MMGYTKLFSEIIMSTVWREPDHIRILWITMLALKDRWHFVNASLPGLADAAKISIKDCEDALSVLSSPDKHSRSSEYEGRRIETCEGGWLILNGEKYRNKMSLDERNEYQRIKQQEYRDREKQKKLQTTGEKTVVDVVKSCLQNGQRFTHTDTDTKADTEQKNTGFAPPIPINPALWDEWMALRKKKKAVNSERAINAIIRSLVEVKKELGINPDDAIIIALEKGWKGIEVAWVQNYLDAKKVGGNSSRTPGKIERAIKACDDFEFSQRQHNGQRTIQGN